MFYVLEKEALWNQKMEGILSAAYLGDLFWKKFDSDFDKAQKSLEEVKFQGKNSFSTEECFFFLIRMN